MTHASVWKSNETVRRVLVKGHTGYAASGSDIVCSSISTAMILTANLITRIADENEYRINIDEKSVIIDIEITEFDDFKVLENIMNNLFDNLEMIQSQYPKYFKISIM